MLREAWKDAPLDGWEAVWCARQSGSRIDAVWSPGDPPPCAADAVLALWGGVPGRGDLDDNTRLAQAAMALGRACGAGRVLHCSSSAVYGPGDTLHEDSVCAPLGAYGVAKLTMEEAIAAEAAPSACVLRLANVTGADSLFQSLSVDGPIVIDQFSNGRGPRRSYATPSGILRAVCALLKAKPLPKVINVALPGAFSMADLIRAAGREFEWREAPEGALAEVVMDTSRLQALTGETAQVEASAIIAEWQRLRGCLE
ncbi:NAD-dependent epimerase/dehydratase family protein (plasmid) [Shimia sp. W99]